MTATEKLIRAPFDLELAKKITKGEIKGSIITGTNKNVRILCFDKKIDNDNIFDFPIVALITDECTETVKTFSNKGYNNFTGPSDKDDLFILISPQDYFKDGDIVKFSNEHYTWLALIKDISINPQDSNCFYSNNYATILIRDIDFKITENFKLNFYGESIVEEFAEIPTESEKQIFINALKSSNDPKAREYLMKFFGFCGFSPFEQVLCRDYVDQPWEIDLFDHMQDSNYPYVCFKNSWMFCIPYKGNEHLNNEFDDF